MGDKHTLTSEYTLLFNATTDCIRELDLIKHYWEQYPMLIGDIEKVIQHLQQSQQRAEDTYILGSEKLPLPPILFSK